MNLQITPSIKTRSNNTRELDDGDADSTSGTPDLATTDAKLLVEIARIQGTLDEKTARMEALERELQQQLEEEGEDLDEFDESLKDARERLSVLLAAGRGSSGKARRIAEGVEVLEKIAATIYKRDTLAKTIESSQQLLQRKMNDFVKIETAAQDEIARKSTRSLLGDDDFVSNRKKHKPAPGQPLYTAKDTQSVFGNEISCCCSSMQGLRSSQEDEHLMRARLPFAKHFSFCAVFDGHGGSATAKLCEADFLSHLQEATDWNQPVFPHDMGDVLTSAHMNFDAWLKKRPGKQHDTTGATALSALISPTHIVVANLGECRALLVRGGKVLVMSQEHKPKKKFELARIKAAGGGVFMGRVNGELGVARAFGDFSLKDSDDLPPEKQMVSCQPDTRTIERSLDDDFLVLATDGVWDAISNKECVKFINAGLAAGKKPQCITNELLDRCLKKRSRDNMTCMLVDFRPSFEN